MTVASTARASGVGVAPNRARLVGHRALRTVPRIAALWDFLAEQLASVERAGELAVPA